MRSSLPSSILILWIATLTAGYVPTSEYEGIMVREREFPNGLRPRAMYACGSEFCACAAACISDTCNLDVALFQCVSGGSGGKVEQAVVVVVEAYPFAILGKSFQSIMENRLCSTGSCCYVGWICDDVNNNCANPNAKVSTMKFPTSTGAGLDAVWNLTISHLVLSADCIYILRFPPVD